MGKSIGVAFEEWRSLRPESGGSCCNVSHFKRPNILDNVIDQLDGKGEPLPDADVCERERAWREYVRIRDCNPEFPFRIKSRWKGRQ